MKYYHPVSGKMIPAVGPIPNGYSRAEELVNVATGHRIVISCEPSVNSGQGVARALAKLRADVGHEGEPVFMTTEAYGRLSDADRKARLAPPLSKPDGAKAEADRLAAENAALKAQIAAAAPAPQKVGR